MPSPQAGRWGALLIVYFVSSSLLTPRGRRREGATQRERRREGGARDAAQVLANGAVFAIAALLQLVHPSPLWLAAGAGALAASAADTWGTEIGMLSQSSPRMITTWRTVPTGTSGGVSVAGMAATVAGALFIWLAAWLVHWNVHVTPPYSRRTCWRTRRFDWRSALAVAPSLPAVRARDGASGTRLRDAN